MDADSSGRVRFGHYELDSESGKLSRDGWPLRTPSANNIALSNRYQERGTSCDRKEFTWPLSFHRFRERQRSRAGLRDRGEPTQRRREWR